jgi:hypothetical protein
MKTAGKKIIYTKKPTKISEFEIFILNPGNCFRSFNIVDFLLF